MKKTTNMTTSRQSTDKKRVTRLVIVRNIKTKAIVPKTTHMIRPKCSSNRKSMKNRSAELNKQLRKNFMHKTRQKSKVQITAI